MRKLMLLMVATTSLVSVAQQTPRVPTQEMIFEGDLIEGDLSKPDVEYFARPRCTSHKSLIKVREEFREKVLQSAGEL